MSETRTRLGRQLVNARHGRRLRLADLAQRTGRQPSRISEIETGKANSTIDSLAEAAAALGLSLVLVPTERLKEALALTAGRTSPKPRPYDVPSVLDELFVDDSAPTDRDEEEGSYHAGQ